MGDAMPQLVLDTLARVAGADDLAARSARPDLIGREDRRRLQIATRPVFPADQASRRVGAAQMRRAVDLPIDDAHGLMRRADRLTAARALRHLVHAHRLVCAGLTAAVVVAADHERRRRAAAMWTGHDPGGRTGRA